MRPVPAATPALATAVIRLLGQWLITNRTSCDYAGALSMPLQGLAVLGLHVEQPGTGKDPARSIGRAGSRQLLLS